MLKFIKFLHNTLGISNDAAATVIITLITAILAILLTELLKSFSSFSKRKNYRKLLRINLINLIKGLYRQAVGYDSFYKQINIGFTNSFEIQQKSISAIGVLEQLGYENLYDACFNGIENVWFFQRSKKAIAFSNLWATLEFLKKFHDQSFIDANKFIELNGKINNERNYSLSKVNNIVDSFRIRIHGEQVPVNLGNYFNAMENIHVELRKQPNYVAPQVMDEFFVKKILALNRNYDNLNVFKQFGNIINPVDMNTALLEASLKYTNQKNLINSYNRNFQELSLGFFRQFDEMKKTYKVLFKK